MREKVTFNHKFLPYLLLAPQLFIIIVFFYLPAGQSFISSFYRETAFGGNSKFVGLTNYIQIFHQHTYYESMGVTLIFAGSVTFVGLALSLLFAVMADRVIKGSSFYKTFLIIPYAIAPAIVGTLVGFMFSPTLGIVSIYLEKLGIHWNPNLNPTDAMILVIVSSVWNQISYNFLFFLAGLQSIPDSVIEASAIDGAGPARRFKDIVFPLLAPTTFFLFIINVIYAFFETFAIIDMTTQGGPGNSTTTLVYSVYKTAFQAYNYGSSGAQSVILMIVIAGLTLIQFKYIEKKIHY